MIKEVSPEIKIGDRTIGSHNKPFFIAELSGNHNGSLNRALDLVEVAFDCGADAIKLQTFTPDLLTLDEHTSDFFIKDVESVWHGQRLWDLYNVAHTPWDWHEPIANRCRALGMNFLSTAFDTKSLEFLLELRVDAVKIASFELVHIPLLERVASVNLPVILSTGMATLDEIRAAYEVFASSPFGAERLILLKCTSAYPSTIGDSNVVTMADLQHKFDCVVGLSDHCLEPFASYAAIALHGSVIEKHLTLDRSDGGVDSSFSLEPREFKELVTAGKSVWESLGSVNYRVLDVEKSSLAERPSIYVCRDILAGEVFNHLNLRVVRPGYGLRPDMFNRICGMRANSNIKQGTALQLSMIADLEGNKLD